MKKFLSATRRRAGVGAAVLGVSALLLAGCGEAPPSSEGNGNGGGEANANSDYLGCIVSDSGGFDDRSFNQSSYEGLKAAQEKLGIKIQEAESQAPTDFEPNLNSMVQSGCDLTVTVGFLLGDATKKVAADNPEQNFAIVDYNDPEFTDNVKPLVYDTAQAAFLAGYLSAGMTETGTVATYGGVKIPTVTIFMDGFDAGIDYYNEQNGTDVKLLGWDRKTQEGTFIGDFENQSAGKTNTENFINEGADIILPVAGPVGLGTVDAVKEANKAGGNVKIVWVDSDGYKAVPEAQDLFLTSVMKGISQSVEDVITADVKGKFSSEPYVGTLENGGVSIAPYHSYADDVPEELKSEIEDIKAGIISGEIDVQSDASPKQ
ncbi:MAG TPA: BMP family ABC transporter substrate-binding protein [Arthrobacter sp.]|nr:BMP family ABC transporter substrate-binding protein [Arthrobacter sp.]